MCKYIYIGSNVTPNYLKNLRQTPILFWVNKIIFKIALKTFLIVKFSCKTSVGKLLTSIFHFYVSKFSTIALQGLKWGYSDFFHLSDNANNSWLSLFSTTPSLFKVITKIVWKLLIWNSLSLLKVFGNLNCFIARLIPPGGGIQ